MDLLEALIDPKTYGLQSDENIVLRETAISWVFLAGNYVYKIKKPVNFGFLDFTTLAKRKYFCNQEVEVNKRLCPDIYLGVIPISKIGEGIILNNEENIIDYAVKLKRLPEDKLMSKLLTEGKINEETIDKIASMLSDFHSRAKIIDGFGYNTVKLNWDENFQQTEQFSGDLIDKFKFNFMRSKVNQFLMKNKALIESRTIKDCHGDLHSGNIFVADKIYIFDAIEFNERFRYGDVASEIAFLAMDLDFHNKKNLSDLLVNKYVSYSGDENLLNLLSFYKCYRAYVRAKVGAFRIEQGDESEKELTKKYFNLAYDYSKSLCADAIIMHGFPGTGKSYLAKQLTKELNAEYLATDGIRRELIGKSNKPLGNIGFGEGIYTPELKQKVYNELFSRAKIALQENKTVILDACFTKKENIEQAYNLAKEQGINPLIVDCICPEDVVKQRLQQRAGDPDSVSEATFQIYLAQKEHAEELDKSLRIATIDTTKDDETTIKNVVNALAYVPSE